MGTSKYIKIKEESLEQLKKYIDALPVASGIYKYEDGVWTDIFLNKKMLQIIGQPSGENELLCKNDPWKFVHEQDFETLKILLDDLVMYEKEVDYRCRINSKRGASLVNISVKTIDETRGKNNDSILVSCIVRELTNLEYELETLYEEKKDNNILTSLTEDPGGGILKYYFKTDIFELYNTSSQNTIYMNKDSFSLENIIETDWIASESLESLQDIYSKLRKGIPKGSAVLRIKNSQGEWNWYLTKYTTLFNDVLEPEYSMIYYKNVTSIRKENMASKRLHDLTKVGINNVFFNIEYNVSLDIFEEMEGTLPEGYSVNPDFSGIKNVKIIARNIHPEDRGKFLRLLSIKYMERSYQRGLCKGTLEFRARYKGGYAWVQLIYHLLEEPYSSNIILWLSLKRINEKKQTEIKLITNAQRDELTGVYNRGTFKDMTISKMAKANEDLVNALIMIGVDNFTKINDKYGYIYGDKVLRDIARTIRLVINEEDIIGRFNGTIFLIYMSNKADKQTVEKILQIIQMAVSRETEDSEQMYLSIGTVLYGPDGREFNELSEKAYIALTHAKKTASHKIVEYKEGLLECSNVKKPIKEEIDNNKRVDIRTFSYFDVFIDGQAVLIPHGKAKELFALLVHRRGGFVTPQEIVAHLWEDEEINKVTLARCRKVFMLLKDTLKKYGVEDILESNVGARRVIPEKINCDLYNYLSGDNKYSHLYNGYYMLNYSWSEFGIAELEEQATKYNNENKE